MTSVCHLNSVSKGEAVSSVVTSIPLTSCSSKGQGFPRRPIKMNVPSMY